MTKYDKIINVNMLLYVTFKLSYYHNENKIGEVLDRGTSFDIDFECINSLFKEIVVPF